MSPLVGTWVANIEKSRRRADHQFESATLTIEVSGHVASLHRTDGAGKAFEQVIVFDRGQSGPCRPGELRARAAAVCVLKGRRGGKAV